MKRIILIIFMFIFIIAGCGKIEEENYLKANWTLDSKLKPSFEFERSNKNDNGYGIFYVDTQITFEDFSKYIKTLKENKFNVDWRYSDTSSIENLEEAYKDKSTKDNIFNDGYINFQMCDEKLCFFMQWVDKENYNSLNKNNPTSYSFKLETIDLIKSSE